MSNSISASQDDTQVRLEDQQKINQFGTLNNRLIELTAEMKQIQADIEKFEDATSEMMMLSGGKIMLLIGESFLDTTEDEATAYCERRVEELQKKVGSLKSEKESIMSKQDILKKELYGRF
eukprot:gene7894-16161_t